MSSQAELNKLSVPDFARRFRSELIPLSNTFAYFAALPLSEDEMKEYLHDPIAALPPSLLAGLGKVALLLVPYLEKASGKGADTVTFTRPASKAQVWSSQLLADGQATVVLALKGEDVADYHYVFYRALASLISDSTHYADALARYSSLLREELRGNVHGEVDEQGWQAKQELVRRQSDAHRDTKLFRQYARQSLIDSLTLYLHGICCDIDVETGPRQIASRHLRKRLQLLEQLFPPPTGYAVFPEELKV